MRVLFRFGRREEKEKERREEKRRGKERKRKEKETKVAANCSDRLQYIFGFLGEGYLAAVLVVHFLEVGCVFDNNPFLCI